MESLANVKTVVENYRETNNETDARIYGFIAVDAISFDRELVVSKNGTVSGTISSESVEMETLLEIH